MKNKRIKNNGFILIIMVGILSILTLLTITFTVISKLEEQTSRNYSYEIRAKYLAEAGVNKAISELREQAKSGFVWTTSGTWYSGYNDGTLLNNCGVYVVTITDCSSQININDTDNDNLDEMLAQLPSITETEADDIITYRNSLPNGVFETKEQTRQVSGLIDAGESYDDFKDYITAHSYVDSFYDYDEINNTYSQTSRSPIDVNTASINGDKTVLKAVLTGISDGTNTISGTEADAVASDIIEDRPLSTWSDFENCLNGSVSDGDISSDEAVLIMNNCNPNKEKPSTFTTEFCFEAGGYFEIESVGTLYKSSSKAVILAKSTILSVVRTHNVMAFSDKPDFNEDLNYNGSLDASEYDVDADGSLDFPSDFKNVNWQDTCPVNSDYDEGLSLKSAYETIPGSLKLGFWDNFDEDNDNTNGVGWTFYNFSHTGVGGTSMQVTDGDGDGDREAWGGVESGGYWDSKLELDKNLNGHYIWSYDDEFSIRVNAVHPTADEDDGDGRDDNCALEFWDSSEVIAKLHQTKGGFLYNPGRIDLTIVGTTVASDPDAWAVDGKDFFDAQLRFHIWKGLNNDRFDHIGNIFYGISECATDHYNNWSADQDNDQYHGVVPTEITYKLVVSDDYTPNYRVYLAVGSGIHYFYDYSTGWYTGSQAYTASTSNYLNIPVHSQTEDSYDRYGYWTAWHNGTNEWRSDMTGWWLVLWEKLSGTKWDELRIIADSGYYVSPWYNPSEGEVRWAALSWTETIPSTASSSSENIAVSIDTGSGFGAATLGSSIDLSSSQIRFKVDLTSNDDDYSETPVFEDITITYIMPTEVLYWKER